MDQKLLFLINDQWTSTGLDSFMATLSCFAAWAPLLVVLAVIVWIRGGFKARTMLVLMGIVIAVSDVVVSDTLKHVVNRPRPREALAGVRIVDLQPGAFRFLSIFKPVVARPSPPAPDHPHGHSFPSGHAINNFCVATLLTLFYRRRGWLYFIPAALICYSRVYVGAHWPSDVLISALMGIGLTLLLVAILDWLWRKYAPDFAPALHARHPGLLREASA